MQTIREILNAKGQDVWTIGPEATVLEALRLLAEKDVGALVVSEGGKVAGIFSERDYARKIIVLDRSSHSTKVKDAMVADVLYVTPGCTIEECMALMTDKHIRHVPVLEDGELAGLVSIGDVVKAVISTKQFLIDQLENYIRGA